MSRIIPLSEWYPAMARRWASSPRRYTVPISERRGWTWHHFAFNATTLDRIRRVADDHYNRWERPGGYNYCLWQGDVLEMCGRDHVGAHAPGGNRNTLGVAFPFDLSRVTPPQDYRHTAGWLLGQVTVPDRQWPHSHWSSTACPGNGGRSIIPITPSTTPPPDPEPEPETTVVLTRIDNGARVYQVCGHLLVALTSAKQAEAIAKLAGWSGKWQDHVGNLTGKQVRDAGFVLVAPA